MCGKASSGPHDLPFACKCGAVRGWVAEAGPKEGDRVVCHCTDCQAFVRWCGATERVLGVDGGTDLYQSRCARLKVESGLEQLASLHLTDKPTLRWYAVCCNTPMFNTFANGKLPYLTTLLANAAEIRREALGPVRAYLFAPSASGKTHHVPRNAMARLMRRFLLRAAKDYASGDRRRSPLFEPRTLQPIAAPRRLTAGERRALEVAGG